MRPRSARQTFPRWHLTEDEAPPARRGAEIIAFPRAAARSPAVVTYPRALVVPKRRRTPAPASGSALWRLAAVLVLALVLGSVASLLL